MTVIRPGSHIGCVACGENNPAGLNLRFRRQPDGSVKASAFCRKELSGYEGMMHGGVAALMLDSAMANALFAAGVTAYTAELAVKYRSPVRIGRYAEVRSRIKADHAPLYILEAELVQDGEVRVRGEAKFMSGKLQV